MVLGSKLEGYRDKIRGELVNSVLEVVNYKGFMPREVKDMVIVIRNGG